MKSIAFSQKGLLANASNDGTISFWDLSDTISTPTRIVDNALPKIAINSPSDNHVTGHNNKEIRISGKVTNIRQIANGKVMVTTENGVDSYSENLQVLRNGNFRQIIPLASGINQITVTAKYKTGKTIFDKITVTRKSPPHQSIHPSETELDIITVDEEMPDFEIVSPIFQNSTVTLDARQTIVKVKATDVSGIDEVRVNDTPAQKVGNDIYETSVSLKVGKNPIYLSVKDILGNVATKRVTIVRPNEVVPEPPIIQPNSDTTPPNIVILSPTERVVRPDIKNITLTGIVTDNSGIYEIQVNGVDATVVENGGFRAIVRLGYGPNPITITATDTKLNTTTERIEITRSIEKPVQDTTGPEIRILTPTIRVQRGVKAKSHVTTMEVVRITGTVTDPSGIYELTINGRDVPVSANRFTTTVQLARGDNRIRVEAIDTLRNISMEEFTVVQKVPHEKKERIMPYCLLPSLTITGINSTTRFSMHKPSE